MLLIEAHPQTSASNFTLGARSALETPFRFQVDRVDGCYRPHRVTVKPGCRAAVERTKSWKLRGTESKIGKEISAIYLYVVIQVNSSHSSVTLLREDIVSFSRGAEVSRPSPRTTERLLLT
jgi:hypothetical protein